jgi:hypothetical protein
MILERAYTGEANDSEFDKWLIHSAGPGLSIKDARELFHDAMSSYNDQCLGEPESEWEAQGFLKPAGKADPASHDLQTIFRVVPRAIRGSFTNWAS